MSTHDYVIDNQTAPNFRADLNNALLAIVSNNSNATAPTVTYANMIWYDTATNTLYMRNEDNDAWIALGTLDQTADTFAAAVSLASQAEAEAGSNNTKLMTPLRVAQAIDVQAEGLVLLGTLTTTSDPTQTLPSLVLTPYKRLLIEVSGVSHDNGSNRALLVGTATTSPQRSSSTLLYGKSEISLSDGVAVSAVDQSSDSARSVFVQLSGITSASTSIVFSWSGAGDFDAGTIRVYGVR